MFSLFHLLSPRSSIPNPQAGVESDHFAKSGSILFSKTGLALCGSLLAFPLCHLFSRKKPCLTASRSSFTTSAFVAAPFLNTLARFAVSSFVNKKKSLNKAKLHQHLLKLAKHSPLQVFKECYLQLDKTMQKAFLSHKDEDENTLLMHVLQSAKKDKSKKCLFILEQIEQHFSLEERESLLKKEKGHTPLDCAICLEDSSVLIKLIDLGADLRAKNSQGLTTLELLCHFPYLFETQEKLLKHLLEKSAPEDRGKACEILNKMRDLADAYQALKLKKFPGIMAFNRNYQENFSKPFSDYAQLYPQGTFTETTYREHLNPHHYQQAMQLVGSLDTEESFTSFGLSEDPEPFVCELSPILERNDKKDSEIVVKNPASQQSSILTSEKKVPSAKELASLVSSMGKLSEDQWNLNLKGQLQKEDNEGNQLLHYAAFYGYYELFIWMLENGADLFHHNHLNETAFHFALELHALRDIEKRQENQQLFMQQFSQYQGMISYMLKSDKTEQWTYHLFQIVYAKQPFSSDSNQAIKGAGNQDSIDNLLFLEPHDWLAHILNAQDSSFSVEESSTLEDEWEESLEEVPKQTTVSLEEGYLNSSQLSLDSNLTEKSRIPSDEENKEFNEIFESIYKKDKEHLESQLDSLKVSLVPKSFMRNLENLDTLGDSPLEIQQGPGESTKESFLDKENKSPLRKNRFNQIKEGKENQSPYRHQKMPAKRRPLLQIYLLLNSKC